MNKKWSIDELQEVWMLITEYHNRQTYGSHKKGKKIVYINHIGSVAFEILKALDEDENLIADLALKCALLHDTIEDTKLTHTAVEEKLGKQIADGVLALTKNELLLTKEEQMADSLKRIKEQPKEIWAVKMADRICNLQEPPYYWDKTKCEEYQQEAQKIWEELHTACPYLGERLKLKIEAYSQYIATK